jgi:ribonuclease HI
MELKAILKALELTQTTYKEEICNIISDSAYCVNSYNEWLDGWANNNWKRSKGKL